MRRKAHSQPPWGDTSLTSVGALTIQARQLNIVGEEERQREAEKEGEEAKKIKLGDKAAKQSCWKFERSAKKSSDKQEGVRWRRRSQIWTEGLTETSVLGEELGELVAVVLVVAAVAAVAVGRDADFGGAQVIGRHHGSCRGGREDVSLDPLGCLYFSVLQIPA